MKNIFKNQQTKKLKLSIYYFLTVISYLFPIFFIQTYQIFRIWRIDNLKFWWSKIRVINLYFRIAFHSNIFRVWKFQNRQSFQYLPGLHSMGWPNYHDNIESYLASDTNSFRLINFLFKLGSKDQFEKSKNWKKNKKFTVKIQKWVPKPGKKVKIWLKLIKYRSVWQKFSFRLSIFWNRF